jgi:hypothetical protein
MRSYNVAAQMVVGLAVAMGMVWGCGGKGKEKAKEKAAEVRSEVKESVPDLDTAERCMEGMMRDPKEPFHLSTMRKDDDAPPFTSEAEFTPETVEGTTNWGTGQKTQQVSSVHSDANAWGHRDQLANEAGEHREWRFEHCATDGSGSGSGCREWLRYREI